MQIVYPRCCGIDVHKKDVKACALLTHPDGTTTSQVRTFATTTDGSPLGSMLALADWLGALDIHQVAMESTGVYWRPVYNILEGDCAVILVNAQHIKAVPGRKTDVKDSEWLADLLRHGLLQPSFIPPAPIRELRDLTRYRKTLIGERVQEANRLQKVLETANIKLAAVATDVLGVSGRQMLAALLGGEQDAEALAELARGRLREKLPQLRRALVGRVQPYHRILIERILAHIDFLEESIAALQREIGRCLVPFAQAVALLVTIPGVSAHAAATLIADAAQRAPGTEMAQFPSAKHLASWAGVCPGNRESGGKRRSGKPTVGNRWVKAVLGEVAWSVSRTRDNYLVAQYQRMARRKGRLKAIGATMHTVLVIAYHVLRDGTPYRDLGADYFDKLDTARLERHHVNRLKALGYEVVLTPQAAA
jgi:transposase